MKFLQPVIILILSCLLASCGGGGKFSIEGTVEGAPSVNLRIMYYDGGSYRSGVTAVREGKFEFSTTTSEPSILEIADNDYRPLARLYVEGGEKFKVYINPAHPYASRIEGNEASARWSAFLNKNEEALSAGGIRSRNAIADYIKANRNDIVSTLLLITEYPCDNADEGLELLNSIAEPARPEALTQNFRFMLQRLTAEDAKAPISSLRYLTPEDTTLLYTPGPERTMLVFTEAYADSTFESIRKAGAAKYKRITELRLANDISNRHLPDTIKWTVGHIPGGLAAPGVERLGIPALPYYIVADATGKQLYRGQSFTTALDSLK